MARKFTGRAGSDWICQAGHPRANGGILESPGEVVVVVVVDRVVGGMGEELLVSPQHHSTYWLR